jgi:hypothetical protein
MTMMLMFNGAVDPAIRASELPMRAFDAVRQSTDRMGALSRAEAEFLFVMDRTGQMGGDAFVASAVKAVRDHLVHAEAPEGQIAEADVDWLLGMVGDRPTAFGRAVVFAVVRACDEAPARLTELAMRAHIGRCLLV